MIQNLSFRCTPLSLYPFDLFRKTKLGRSDTASKSHELDFMQVLYKSPLYETVEHYSFLTCNPSVFCISHFSDKK